MSLNILTDLFFPVVTGARRWLRFAELAQEHGDWLVHWKGEHLLAEEPSTSGQAIAAELRGHCLRTRGDEPLLALIWRGSLNCPPHTRGSKLLALNALTVFSGSNTKRAHPMIRVRPYSIGKCVEVCSHAQMPEDTARSKSSYEFLQSLTAAFAAALDILSSIICPARETRAG